MGKRCVHEHGDGRQCSYRGELNDDELCPRHAPEIDRWIEAVGNREDCNRFLEPMVNGRVGEFEDHTAPWHCREFSCDRCRHKPTYQEYMAARLVTS